jgi:hypothetical protein
MRSRALKFGSGVFVDSIGGGSAVCPVGGGSVGESTAGDGVVAMLAPRVEVAKDVPGATAAGDDVRTEDGWAGVNWPPHASATIATIRMIDVRLFTSSGRLVRTACDERFQPVRDAMKLQRSAHRSRSYNRKAVGDVEEDTKMNKRTAVWAAVLTMVVASLLPAAAAGANATSAPRWVKHVQSYSGGISNGVRQALEASNQGVRPATSSPGLSSPSAAVDAAGNRQMNSDSDPAMPQDETAVAASITHPLIAVSAANDYVGGGVVVMRTTDGGRNWVSKRITPIFSATGEPCSGGDPSVAYSLRDDAFYLSQLCFFRSLSYSEAHVYKSVDNGQTWTAPSEAAVSATNYDYFTQEVDDSIFVDKEYITVDNYPSSPYFGRLYVTWTKFHIKPSGFSDYCPIQLAYTDDMPTHTPTDTVFEHTKVQPNNPNGGGRGRSANQFSVPVVEADGAVDIAFVEEDCNSSRDRKLLFQKSMDGGDSFLTEPVRVDDPGQWRDSKNADDVLPNKPFRAPNAVSLAYSPTTGTLAFAYTNYIDKPTSGGDVAVSLSHDGGLTWGGTQTVSTKDDGVTPARNDQFFPWIAADSAGNFWIIWFDSRRDPDNHDIDTFQAMSADDGVTWPNTRISSESWDPDRAFFHSASFIGDYNGLAVSDAAVYPVWTDARNSQIDQTGLGESDIWTNYEPLP